MKVVLLLALYGQYDSSIPILSSDRIDVEGTWSAPEPEDDRSPEEIIQDAQRKAEMNNVKTIAKDIENMKVDRAQTKEITTKEKAKLSDKIKNVFSSATGETYNGTPAPAPTPAPLAAPTAAAPTATTPVFSFQQLRLAPALQFLNWTRNLNINKKYKYGLGLALETVENSQYAAGFGINYIRNDIESYDTGYYSSGNFNYGQIGSYGPYPYGTYGYRTIDTSLFQIQVNGKYFLLPLGKFKLYVAGKLGFNYLGVSYGNNNNSNNFYGNEKYTNSYIDAQISGGVEFEMSPRFGVNFDMGVGKTLFSLNDDSHLVLAGHPDQIAVYNIGKDLTKSASVALTFGIYYNLP